MESQSSSRIEAFVTEDCGITAKDLAAAGIGQKVIDAVVLLTRTDQNEGDGYYISIRDNSIALAVKKADIKDNMYPARTAQLDPEKREELSAKYAHALEMLTRKEPRTLSVAVTGKKVGAVAISLACDIGVFQDLRSQASDLAQELVRLRLKIQ